MANFVKATTSFAGAAKAPGLEAVQVDIVEGRTYRDDHPAFHGREHLFEPLEDSVETSPTRVPRRQASSSKPA